MNHSKLNLQGFNQEELTIMQDVLNDLFFMGGISFNNTLCDMLDTVKTAQPASWVLADTFADVEAMSLEIPDHILESDEGPLYVTCPCCNGEKWLETTSNGWTSALFSDSRRAYAHRALNHSYKPCDRCNGSGQVLDLAIPSEICHFKVTSVQPTPVTSYLTPRLGPVLQLAA
jgi:hypothetical protein